MRDLMRLKQAKIKFNPRIKLNLNIYTWPNFLGMGIEEAKSLAKKVYPEGKKRCGKKVRREKGAYS